MNTSKINSFKMDMNGNQEQQEDDWTLKQNSREVFTIGSDSPNSRRILKKCKEESGSSSDSDPEDSILFDSEDFRDNRNNNLNKAVKSYFLYYHSNNTCLSVSKKKFCLTSGRIFINGENYYKIVAKKGKVRESVANLKGFKAQTISEALHGLKGVLGGLVVVGKVSNILQDCKNLKLTDIVLECLNVILCAIGVFKSKGDVLSIVSLLIQFYLCIKRIPESFVAQSLDAVMMSAMKSFLPTQLQKIVSDMHLFAGVKILDNPCSFYEIIKKVVDFLRVCLSYIPWQAGRNVVEKWFDAIVSKVLYVEINKYVDLYDKFKKDPSCVQSVLYREDIKKKLNVLLRRSDFIEWTKRSETVKKMYIDLERFLKVLLSYDAATRVEPSCFVFDGKPGLLKSVYMNNLISYLNLPCYYHNTKSCMEGKDWYDAYNGEDIFCMDDVGQQGVSQWRTIINFVSPIKLPLDCANADLKDTKFFTSEKIFLTTNKLIGLDALITKQDCISDVNALYRRTNVFQFNVIRDGKKLSGFLWFKHFDGKDFINDFPKDIKEFITQKNLKIPTYYSCDFANNAQEPEIIGWMASIVNIFDAVRKNQQKSNVVNRDDVDKHVLFKAQSGVEEDELLSMMFRNNSMPSDSDTEVEDDFDYLYESEKKPTIIAQNPNFYGDTIKEDLVVEKKVVCEEQIKERRNSKNFIRFIAREIKEYFLDMLQDTKLSIGTILLGLLVFVILAFLFSYFLGKEKVETFVAQTVHPSLTAISNLLFKAKFVYKTYEEKQKSVINKALCTGRFIITTAHTCLANECYVTVYKGDSHIIVDNLLYKCVFRCLSNDVAVFACSNNMPRKFKSLSNHFKTDGVLNKLYLVSDKVLEVNATQAYKKGVRVEYQEGSDYSNVVRNPFIYNYEGAGLCGSVLYDLNVGIVGLHVAGNNKGKGLGLIWDTNTRDMIRGLLSGDIDFEAPFDISPKTYEDISAMKLDTKVYVNTPDKTNIGKSDLYGVFPVNRRPANLQKYGKHTIKDIFKKSLAPVEEVCIEELEFAEKALLCMIEPFTDISEKEVVEGNEYLAGLNKKSSNGYKCKKEKEDYIDFNNKKFQPEFEKELDMMLNDAKKGVFDIEKFIWCETLKDELRDISKEDEPRSFRVSTIHLQCLTKLLTGGLVSNILRHRDFNGIAIGMNPVKEWGKIYDELQSCEGRIWASDIKKWDGSMLPQVQQLVNKVILHRYKGEHKEMLELILNTMFNCYVAVNDDLWLTTHSMPSGSFLTALFNSLVNRVYSAMWFYRYAKNNSLTNFFKTFKDYVLGDDKVCGVKDKNEGDLNALTFLEFYKSIGLNATDSRKNQIVSKYDDIDSITFLKRSFRWHPKIGKIICPLDIKTIESTLSWVDKTKVYSDVVRDKLHAAQREFFLHFDVYEEKIEQLEAKCKEVEFPFTRLPEAYLMHLYEEGDEWKQNFSGEKYM